MRVLVLGAGPSGLIAAAAAEAAGHDVLIYSRNRRKSMLYGCQYLHAPIPAYTRGNPVVVSYNFEGTADQYRAKVYGRTRVPVQVSPETLTGQHLAWDIRDTYDRLWERFEDQVQDWDANVEPAHALIAWAQPDRVVSTVPRNLLCGNPSHRFATEEVWALGDAPDRGQTIPITVYGDNVVQCDGTEDHSWYRISRVFGYGTVEWPGHLKRPPLPGTARVQKPLTTDCTCEHTMPAPTLLIGRYGLWRKGILAHEGYTQVSEWLRTAEQAALF